MRSISPLDPGNIARREEAYARAAHCVAVQNVKHATDEQLLAAFSKIKRELKLRGLK